MKAKFTRADIKKRCDAYIENLVKATVEALKFVGEDFITNSRNLRTYIDRTGNLRSSIGYLILVNGEIIQSVFEAGVIQTETGKQTGEAYARKIAEMFGGNRIVFIGVAGMDYAVYVEAKGRDVITGSSVEAKKLLLRLIERINKK